jgi:hypothetical protein
MGNWLLAKNISVGTKTVDGEYEVIGYATNQGDEVIVVQDKEGRVDTANVNDLDWPSSDDKYGDGCKHGKAIAEKFIKDFIETTYLGMKKVHGEDYSLGLVDAIRDRIGNLMHEDIEDMIGKA